MEVHIHPIGVNSVREKRALPYYLHTSPEFCMKELLADKSEDLSHIFTLTYCFRDEPNSPIHRSQFIMLEWYRAHERYEKIMEDVEGLIDYCLKSNRLPVRKNMQGAVMVRKTMQQLFQEILGIDILNYLTTESIKKLLQQFPDVPVPQTELPWDDYFFLLFLNKIEPEFQNYPLLMVTEFPAPLSALSTLKASDPRVCERFEVYINGVELCNCFNELTDLEEQRRRFESQAQEKKELYQYELPEPKKFYSSMAQGLPPSSGVALGVERLLSSLFEVENPFFY